MCSARSIAREAVLDSLAVPAAIVDGTEGGQVKDPDNVVDGMRIENGSKSSGLPWVNEIERDRMVLPERESIKLHAENEADCDRV